MSRFNEVKVRQNARRFGLPQLALLTGAFITAVLLAAALRPSIIPFAELRSWGSGATPSSEDLQRADERAQMERDAAQEKLAAAMARFTDAAHAQRDAQAPAATASIAPPAASPSVAPMASPPSPIMEAQPAPAPIPAPVMAPAPTVTLPVLSEADRRRLNDKASQAMRDGDILGARLILERTIEGGDAKALLALAETYDPKALSRMNVKGVKGDADHARQLYAEALARGVNEARGRLDALDR